MANNSSGRHSLWLVLNVAICAGLNWWMCPAPRECVSPMAMWKLPATLFTIMWPVSRHPSPGCDDCWCAFRSLTHCSEVTPISITFQPRDA